MRVLATAFVFASVSLPGFAQQFSPLENLGPAIPTPQLIVERMLSAGRVKPGEMVYDLGSGDGRIVIMAAQKFGARAVGVELMPDIARKARERVASLGLADRVSIVEGNALRVDVSPADVVTMWFLTNSNDRLRPNLEKHLKLGSRVVSNEFPVRGWKPAEVIHVKIGRMEHTIYVYEMGHTQ